LSQGHSRRDLEESLAKFRARHGREAIMKQTTLR
jgi:hypothetical protein